jgi:hypothetical protein
MNSTAHASGAFLAWNLLYWVIDGQGVPPAWACALILVFGVFPDFDGVYWLLKCRGAMDNTFQHHLMFWSHWPLAYWPLVVANGLLAIFLPRPALVLVPVIGIYAHFVGDSACCGDGMMWGKPPYHRGQYAPFINLFSKQTDGYHGGYWTVRFRRTKMFRVAQVLALAAMGTNIVYMVITAAPGYLLPVIALAGMFLADYAPVDSKYLGEPPNGRYDDYRRDPGYLAWMRTAGYTWDAHKFAVRGPPPSE